MSYSMRQICLQEEILKLLIQFDKEFIRTISSRVGDLSQYAKKLAEQSFVYVAERENNVVGFIMFYANNWDTKQAYLSQIAVYKDYREMGIGKDLLNLFLCISRKNGMKIAKLEVDKCNYPAISLYESFKFRIDGEASEVSQYMVLEL